MRPPVLTQMQILNVRLLQIEIHQKRCERRSRGWGGRVVVRSCSRTAAGSSKDTQSSECPARLSLQALLWSWHDGNGTEVQYYHWLSTG